MPSARNDGEAGIALTGANSPACGMLMLHRSDTPSGVLAFAPGGYHLMCIQPSPALKPGATVPVTLKFADRSRLTVEFAVRNAAGE